LFYFSNDFNKILNTYNHFTHIKIFVKDLKQFKFKKSLAVKPDVIRKKMNIKVPDALPRAIDPEDVKHLLSISEIKVGF